MPTSILNKIDRLLILIAEGDSRAAGQIRKAIRESECPEAEARMKGVRAALHLKQGQISKAEILIRTSWPRVRSTQARVELAGRASKARIELGLPLEARALTDRCLVEAAGADEETQALALFDSAVSNYYCGAVDKARLRWSSALYLTERAHYRLAAEVNLAVIATESGDFESAEAYLVSPVRGRCPRGLQSFREVVRARVCEARGDLEGAVAAQELAIELASHCGALERAVLSVNLAKYLLLAGESGMAQEVGVSMASLVFALEEERHKLAAAAALELSQAAAAARISEELIATCQQKFEADKKAAVNRPGRRHLRPSRSARSRRRK